MIKQDFLRRGFWVIFLTALAVRVLLVMAVPYVGGGDAIHYDALAWSLVQGHGYSFGDGQPTAYIAPGYPLLVAAIYRLFGHSLFAGRLGNVLLDSVTAGIVYLLAKHLLTSRSHSRSSEVYPLAGGLLYALNPSVVFWSTTLMTETSFTMLFALALLFALSSYLGEGKQELVSRRKAMAASTSTVLGILGGLMALVKPAALVLVAAFGLIGTSGMALKQKWLRLSVIYGVAALVLLPWVLRNWMVSGHITLANEAAFPLWIGNTRLVEPIWDISGVSVPWEGLTEWEANAVAVRETFHFVLQHPSLFLINFFRKVGLMLDMDITSFPHAFWWFWGEDAPGTISTVLKTTPFLIPFAVLPMLSKVLLVLGGLLGCLHRFSFPWRRVVLGSVGVWLLPYSLTYASSRYMVPMTPLLTLPLAWFVTRQSNFQSSTSEFPKATSPISWMSSGLDLVVYGLIILASATWVSTALWLARRILF